MVVLTVRYFREKGEMGKERFDSDVSKILYDECLCMNIHVYVPNDANLASDGVSLVPEGGFSYDPDFGSCLFWTVWVTSLSITNDQGYSFNSLARRNQLRPCRSPKQR